MQETSKLPPDSFYLEAKGRVEADFRNSSDLIWRKVLTGASIEADLLYLKDLVDEESLQNRFIVPLASVFRYTLPNEKAAESLPSANLKTSTDPNCVTEELLLGSALFLSPQNSFVTIFPAPKKMERSIQEPQTEKSIKGAHDGFIETMESNMGILRRKIHNPGLKFRMLKIGSVSDQNLCIAYMEQFADSTMLEQLIRRLQSIEIDCVPAIGYIAKALSKNPNSPFEQYQLTERPDKAMASLMEGRFVLILDGVPNVLIAPVTFISFFQTMDDFGRSWFLGSFLRTIRYISFLITIFLPSLYLAFTGFHYYMIPFTLLTTLAQSRSKVPFSPFIEILILEFAIEALREATIRLPTYIGMTIGVVGGIVIGQAAVEAGIISNLLLIITGFAAICASTQPSYDHALAVRLTRFFCILCTAVFGIIGMAVFAMLFFGHLISLESLGQPFLKADNPYGLKKRYTIKKQSGGS